MENETIELIAPYDENENIDESVELSEVEVKSVIDERATIRTIINLK